MAVYYVAYRGAKEIFFKKKLPIIVITVTYIYSNKHIYIYIKYYARDNCKLVILQTLCHIIYNKYIYIYIYMYIYIKYYLLIIIMKK
jgi:hypothetical protein